MNSSPATLPSPPPLPNSYWVLPGQLLAGEYPADPLPTVTAERLARLQQAGITCFIDLTEARETPGYRAALPPGMRHVSMPIPDHGVPAAREHMSAILTRIREALAEGARVYVHCRAGIGRTATVIGCLLVEQGRSGSEALGELNRLWQQSARAVHWPSVPETHEQSQYVERWSSAADPLLEPGTLAAANDLRARFLGTLLGLALGDALAAATQFARPGRFTAVADLLGGGPFDLPRGAWSDDTAMALCLAESLLERSGFDGRDQVQRYRRWQQQGHLSATGQCLGITANTARALSRAQWRRQGFAGNHDPMVQDPEVLSRVAPVALYFFARGTAAIQQAATDAARITCQAPAALAACRSLARALYAALCGQDKAAILAVGRAAEPPSPGTRVEAAPNGASPALAAALSAFERTASLREALLAAANLGGNSDVVAAACGALAGAHYGAGAIPASWRNSLMKHELIEATADRLLTQALLELGS